MVTVNSTEATRRVVLLKRSSKYCKYFLTLFSFFIAAFYFDNANAHKYKHIKERTHTHQVNVGNGAHT